MKRCHALCALRGQARDQRGQSLVEFVLALPILLVLVFGIIEFASAWRTYQIVTNVAREGARLGVVASTPATGAGLTTVTNYMDQLLQQSNLSLARRTTTVTCIPQTGAPQPNQLCAVTGDRLEVQLDYQHDFVVLGPVLNLMCASCGTGYGTVTLTSISRMRDE